MFEKVDILHLIDFKNAPQEHTMYTERCTKSIQKYFMDWNIRYWNEDDFLYIITQKDWKIPHGEHLLQIGAWAIISDIIRLYALYHYGGVYADWDVEFLQEIPQHHFDFHLVLGFEPYTHDGVGTAQVGMQCCIAKPGHPIFLRLYDELACTLWTKDFDILPGICTRVLEYTYRIPVPRSANTYFYLDDDICIVPNDIFYPFMGARVFEMEPYINEEILYNRVRPHTVALHWEFSQIKNKDQDKKGWTNYLDILRNKVN